MNPEKQTLTYPAIYHEDDENIYIEIPSLGVEEFKIPLSKRNEMVDIAWNKGLHVLNLCALSKIDFPKSQTLDDLEVFEGNKKDAFLLEYIPT